LSRAVTERDLVLMFMKFGTVKSFNIITDKKTGASKGFGFVDMPEQSEALAAIKALDGKFARGQKLRVKKSTKSSQPLKEYKPEGAWEEHPQTREIKGVQKERSVTGRPTGRFTERPTERSTGRPTRRFTEKPAGRSTDRPTERSYGRPGGRTSERPPERPTERSTGWPTRRFTEKPAGRSAGRPPERSYGRPAGRPAERPTEGSTWRPTRRFTEKSAGRSTARPMKDELANPRRKIHPTTYR
jgi:RNA recognition motif-containing protein